VEPTQQTSDLARTSCVIAETQWAGPQRKHAPAQESGLHGRLQRNRNCRRDRLRHLGIGPHLLWMKLGEQVNRPIMSSTTRICPSQSTEAPIPMVGGANRSVMARASGSVVFSITTLNAPASAIALASDLLASQAAGDRRRIEDRHHPDDRYFSFGAEPWPSRASIC
jgi:hypothetical protein